MALNWPLQRRGSTGEPVRSVQYNLRAHGHTVTVDGDFGPNTEAAVRAFQSANGLASDGIVGNHTFPALVKTVREGNTGEAVEGVQSQAQFRNLSGDPSKGLAIDGIFGPKTRQFVRSFQEGVGIAVDGIVGPVTWNHLVKEELAG